VHTPLFSDNRFAGKSAAGPFGDMVEELDWAVGEILKKLRTLDSDTIVFFTSDNGPYLEKFVQIPVQNASITPFRGGKGQHYEGGFRVPAIVWGTGKHQTRQNIITDTIASALDIFPTILNKACPASYIQNLSLKLDGNDLGGVLNGSQPVSGWRFHPYFCENILAAVRYYDETTNRHFKLHFALPQWTLPQAQACPNPNPMSEGTCMCNLLPLNSSTLLLYDLVSNPKEDPSLNLLSNPAGPQFGYYLSAVSTISAWRTKALSTYDARPFPTGVGLIDLILSEPPVISSLLPCCDGVSPCTCNKLEPKTHGFSVSDSTTVPGNSEKN